jgi:hypothetical protein
MSGNAHHASKQAHTPAKHGAKHSGALTDQQMANIVFNETRSLSGDAISDARKNIAHTLINAQLKPGRRPETGPTVAHIPKQESDAYQACVAAVAAAREERKNQIDPTKGATNFNFRKNNSVGDFFGFHVRTQIGPLDNSYPTKALPAANIYANTYGQ